MGTGASKCSCRVDLGRPRTPPFFAAGPPQGKKAPSGGSKPAQRAQRGGATFAAGPPQGKKAPSGGKATGCLSPPGQAPRPAGLPRRYLSPPGQAPGICACRQRVPVPLRGQHRAHRDRTGRADGSGAGRAHFMLMSDASFPAWRASWPWFWPVSGLVSACCWRRWCCWRRRRCWLPGW
ncbi:hypothetical protein F7890_23015 [Bordetella bronchiseptica]|nr:hypothetical protein F7D00_23015 [Bordetella bronchiseptica]KAB1568358.1 hypothetical protein F7890_23015 [Bordetella bronchiseptica]